MKRFEIPEISDDMPYVTIRYYNDLDDPNASTNLVFYTTQLSDKALVTLIRTCQTIYDQATAFGQTQNYPDMRFAKGFTNAELKKLKKENSEAAINHIIFSLAVTLQEVTTSIFDATADPNTPIPTLISNILGSLNSAFSLKNTLKILDSEKLAPNTLTKNNIAMAKNLRDALKDIISVASVIFEEYTNEEFLAEQDFATRSGIKIAAALVRKIYNFAKTSHDNFDIVIKAYETKPQNNVKKSDTTAASTTEETVLKRNLTELAKNMTYPQVKERIAALKAQIQKNRAHVPLKQQTVNEFDAYSTELHQKLREPNKTNADRLMEILAKTNPNQALALTCKLLKENYDTINPKKEYRTHIGEKLAEATKALRKKSGAAIQPKKQQEIAAHYDNLWTAVTNHINSTIKEDSKFIHSINNQIQEDEEELMFLESIRKPHIFTKAFWVNLWLRIHDRLFGPVEPKIATKSSEAAQPLEVASTSKNEPLEGSTFKSSAYSKPVGGSKASVEEVVGESIEVEIESEEANPKKK